MGEFLAIAYGAGLKDGLNPCIFMTCAVFIAQGFWLKCNSLSVFWLRLIFVVIYFFSSLVFNFGPGQIIIIHNQFVWAAKIIYFALSITTFILGVLLFKDWFLLRKDQDKIYIPAKKAEPFLLNGLLIRLIIVIAAIILSSLATIWPINNYILLLGNEAIIRSQWQNAVPLLGTYGVVCLWPLWIVWIFLTIKHLRPSMLKIISSAIFLTASSCAIFIFK